MNHFLSRMFGKLSRSNLAEPDPATLRSLIGDIVGGRPAEVRTNRPSEQVVMVFGCLTARREAIASVPLRISNANDNLIDDGPVFRLLEQPNAEMGWDQYVRVLETNLTLYDCMAIRPVGDPAAPDELIPLHPMGLRPIEGVHVDAGTPVVMGWEYIDPTTGAMRKFAPHEIVVHKGYNPHAPLKALSPISVAGSTIEADQTARAQNLALLRAGGTPPYYLGTEQVITKEQADEILEKWEARDNFFTRRRPKVTWGGLKVQQLGLSPEELQYLEGLKFHRHDYYIIFRVCPAMVMDLVGESALSGGTSTTAQKVAWWGDVGLSELDLIAGVHQRLLAPLASKSKGRRTMSRSDQLSRMRSLSRAPRESSGTTMWFDDNVIPALVEHRLGKVQQFKEVANLGYPPDEVSDWLDLGLPPHPTNQAMIPFGMQPVGDTGRMISKVDDRDLPEETPAQIAPTPVDQVVSGVAEAVQDTALNGAQVASLMQIVTNAVAKQLPLESAAAIIKAAFPALDDAKVSKILDPLRKFKPADPVGTALARLETVLSRSGELPPKFQSIRQQMDKTVAELERAAARKWSRYFMEQRGRVLARLKGDVSREYDVDLSRADVSDLITKLFPLEDETELLIQRMTALWLEELKAGWELTNTTEPAKKIE